MQYTHTRLNTAHGRKVCLVLLPIVLLAFGSCASEYRMRVLHESSLQVDPSWSTEENLQRLAGREQQAKNLTPIDAAIPPGIEPEALTLRASSDERAHQELESALRELVAKHHPDATNDTDEKSEETNDAEETAVEQQANSEALRHYTRGRQAMLDERYYIAISELQKAVEHDPDSVRVRRELARAYLAMNNQSRAMEQFAALRRIDPDDSEAVFSLGLHAANRREFQTALAILGRRLLNGEPFDHDPAAGLIARFIMSFSLRQLGYDRGFVQSWTLEATELPMTGELFERTIYAARLGSIYRQRAEMWRSVGDAHCRLGEYRRALDAYAISAALPTPDPAALHLRVVYANLRLGRVYSAQYELLAALKADNGSITERDIRLCAYLADTIAANAEPATRGEWPVLLLAEYVRERYEHSPDDPPIARAAAALLPPEEARQVLRDFVERRPRDLDVFGSLLAWLGARDLDSAIALTIDMVAANPDLAAQYVSRLIFSVPDPVKVLEGLDTHLPSERASATWPTATSHDIALTHVKARVLAMLGGLGEAWQLTEAHRPAAIGIAPEINTTGDDAATNRRLRNAAAIALFRLRLVTQLEEPSLLNTVSAEIAPEAAGELFNDTEAWVARARMWRSFNRFDEAMDAIEQAVSIAERPPITNADEASRLANALLEQARTYAAYAASLDLDSARAQWAEEAVFVAERVINDLQPDEADADWQLADADIDAAFEIILTTFGPNGILRDGPQFREAAMRLYERAPDSRLYVRMMAEEAISQGRFDLALERAMNLYDTHPHETGAIELAMMAWSRMDQPEGMEQARQWLNDRLALRPGDPALLETWVQVGLRLDRADEVIRTLRDMTENRPRHITALRLLESAYRVTGRTDLAFSLGEQRLLNRPRGVRREVELAALYGGAGMEREAMSRLQWLLANIADAGYDHLLTAIAILGRIEPTNEGHDDLTIDLVHHAVFERSARVPLQVYAAALRSLGRQGRTNDAVFGELVEHAAEYAQGAGESSEPATQWRNLAQALIDDDLPRAAAAAVRGRVEADAPLTFEEMSFLSNIAIVADAAVRGGEQQAQQSIAFLERLAARDQLPVLFGMNGPPTLTDALYQASLIYSIVGDHPGAKRILEALVDIAPDNAMALNNLGYLRVEAGHDDEQTKRWIESAIKLSPEDSHILDTIGWLRYKQGRFDDDQSGLGALSLIEASVERATDPSAEVHDHLGDVLWRLGRHEEAADAWRMAERILADDARREEIVRNYLLIQQRGWGLVVADPEKMYDRDYGKKLTTVRKKLEAAEAGEEPPIAPTFAEGRENTGD